MNSKLDSFEGVLILALFSNSLDNQFNPRLLCEPFDCLIEFYWKFWYHLIRKTLENDNTLGTQIKNILKTLWTIPLLPWFWMNSSIVISVNRDLNYDSNGFKIMKNGLYNQKLWQFLVLKVSTKLYQLASTQLIYKEI